MSSVPIPILTSDPTSEEQLVTLGPDGRYRLLKLIGSGGMALVYCARDTVLEIDVALKLLRPDFNDRPNIKRRFVAEAQAMARLNGNRGIVQIFDIGSDSQGHSWITMTLVNGGSLWKRLMEGEGPLSAHQTAGVGIEVLRALGFAHCNGIVHRDIKPQNILIGNQGEVIVTDFGIARLTYRSEAERHTSTKATMGTWLFMAPEQAKDPRNATPKSDVYSVGVLLFTCYFAVEPYTDLHASDKDSDFFGEMPKELVGVIRQATRFDPSERYSASEMMEALQAIRDSLPTDEDEYPLVVPAPWDVGKTIVPGVPKLRVVPNPRLRKQPEPIQSVEAASDAASDAATFGSVIAERAAEPPRPSIQTHPKKQGLSGRTKMRVAATTVVVAALAILVWFVVPSIISKEVVFDTPVTLPVEVVTTPEVATPTPPEPTPLHHSPLREGFEGQAATPPPEEPMPTPTAVVVQPAVEPAVETVSAPVPLPVPAAKASVKAAKPPRFHTPKSVWSGTTLPIAVNIPDGGGKYKVTVYYRSGTVGSFTSRAITLDANGIGSVSLPFGPEGIQYHIQAVPTDGVSPKISSGTSISPNQVSPK